MIWEENKGRGFSDIYLSIRFVMQLKLFYQPRQVLISSRAIAI